MGVSPPAVGLVTMFYFVQRPLSGVHVCGLQLVPEFSSWARIFHFRMEICMVSAFLALQADPCQALLFVPAQCQTSCILAADQAARMRRYFVLRVGFHGLSKALKQLRAASLHVVPVLVLGEGRGKYFF